MSGRFPGSKNVVEISEGRPTPCQRFGKFSFVYPDKILAYYRGGAPKVFEAVANFRENSFDRFSCLGVTYIVLLKNEEQARAFLSDGGICHLDSCIGGDLRRFDGPFQIRPLLVADMNQPVGGPPQGVRKKRDCNPGKGCDRSLINIDNMSCANAGKVSSDKFLDDEEWFFVKGLVGFIFLPLAYAISKLK